MELTTRPDIFGYLDYRKFLADYYRWQKSLKHSYSYRYLARQAQIKSGNYFKYIMDGHRHLSHRFFDQVVNALEIDSWEQRHFERLWKFSITKCPDEKKKLYLKIKQVIANDGEDDGSNSSLLAAKLNYLSDFNHLIVREYIAHHSGQKSPVVIGRALGMQAATVRSVLSQLRYLGLIAEDENGCFIAVQNVVEIDQGVPIDLINKAHADAIDRVKDQINDVHPDLRELGILVTALGPKNLVKAKIKIRELLQELSDFPVEVASSGKSDIYQLSIQLMPVTKK